MILDQKLNEFNERVEIEFLEILEKLLVTECSEIEATNEQSGSQAQQNSIELAIKRVVLGLIDEMQLKYYQMLKLDKKFDDEKDIEHQETVEDKQVNYAFGNKYESGKNEEAIPETEYRQQDNDSKKAIQVE